jgi:hypothetical protein
MEVLTYILSEDGHHIPKHYTPVGTLTGSVRDAVDIENPTIRVDHVDTDAFNYIYIPEFNRYYYVLDRVQVRTGITDLICHVDVLESFYRQFIYSPMIASRSDSTYNKFIPDGERVFQQDQLHIYKNLGGFSGDFSMIMVTVG